MLGLSAVFIILSYRTDMHIEDFVGTTEGFTENKTDTKPVTTDKKIKQAEFDKIMSEIAMRNQTQNPVTVTNSEGASHLLLDPNSKWMPWEEYKNASPEARKAMADQFKEPGSIEADVQRLIKEYDENFDLEAVIEQSPYLQHLRDKHEEDNRKRYQEMAERERLLADIQERRTFILNEAEKRGAILVYDDSGNPVDYEKDEQGNPILMPVTENTRPLENEPKENNAVPIQTPDSNNNVTPTVSDLEFKVTELWINAFEQYPDTIISQYLSKEEFDTFFPTKELRQSLEERKTQMQNDVTKQIQNILPNSLNNREQVIFQLRKSLSENWDSDFADAVIEQLQRDEK